MRGKPVTINHKSEISDDDKVGIVNDVWFNPDDGWYWCNGVIWDEAAQNLITDKGWSVSCSYCYTKCDDTGGTENNIPYDIEFLDGEFEHLAIVDNPRYEGANIVFNSKTVVQNYNQNQPRVPKGNPNGGQFCGSNKAHYASYNDFVNEFSDYIEDVPEDYKISDVEEVKKDLGVSENQPKIIKTPIEEVELRADRIEHIINGGGDGHLPDKTRYKCINKMLATLERPNIIVGYDNGNKGYYKVFKGENKNKNQIVSIHKDENGDFVYTAMPSDKGSNYFIKQINKGNILYKKAAGTQKNAAVNNIITDNRENFNPDIKNNVQNNKEQDMTLLDELKKLITKVENDKGEDMDKKQRIMNILNSANVDEDVKKEVENELDKEDEKPAEKADNEKEDDPKSEKDTADNKKVKNEETKEDEKKYDDLKKDVKEDVENKCKNSVDNAKGGYFDKMNEIYNAATQPAEENTYISREQKLKYAEEYFAK